MSSIVTTDERTELRTAVKSIRQEWRERLSLASRMSPNSKLAKKAGVLLLDLDSLEDRIQEAGGEEELVFVICAQVASGCTLTDWCAHYVLERGLVWAFLTERDEWYERYQRALKGVADHYVGEMVGIADDAKPEEINHATLKIKTRELVSKKYDHGRFGDKPVGVAVQNNITIVHESA